MISELVNRFLGKAIMKLAPLTPGTFVSGSLLAGLMHCCGFFPVCSGLYMPHTFEGSPCTRVALCTRVASFS